MAVDLIRPNIGAKYMPIYLESLRIDTVLNFDLFIKIGNEMILYRSADLPFTEKTRNKLLENKVARLYVSKQFRQQYQKYIEQNLDKILIDRQIPEPRK
ncbi:MAG: hypothetical protein AB1746_12620, partial [Candidatus Zixiibacteriota bacterium]